MLLELKSLLKLKEEQEKQRENRSGVATAILVTLLSIMLPFVLVYVSYKNNQFVFNCKNGNVIQWIVANVFAIFYYIYTFFTSCNK